VLRNEEDRRRGAVIEGLLCHGRAILPDDLLREAVAGLERFTSRGLATLADAQLTIAEAGRPYARTIAALFDGYRQDSVRRFSSAV